MIVTIFEHMLTSTHTRYVVYLYYEFVMISVSLVQAIAMQPLTAQRLYRFPESFAES